MDNVVVIAGAGFSKVCQIPLTSELLDNFVISAPTPTTPKPLQDAISLQLARFWKESFGWNRGRKTPTFEDHFTALDLAANTGHHFGQFFSPSRLRAIRRLSLHRVFEILDQRFQTHQQVSRLIAEMVQSDRNAIVSTNWDIVFERHLQEINAPYHYGIPIQSLDGPNVPPLGLEVLKLHGSANWCYCDDCRRLFANSAVEGKGAYKRWLFLEKRDFIALEVRDADTLVDWAASRPPRCPECRVRLSARVATFSFDKALGFFQFQGIWEQALRRLRSADHWIFIGYSLPEADFELRHLFKTAQLSGDPDRQRRIDVVLKGDAPAAKRFRRFFGDGLTKLHKGGFEAWALDAL